MFLSYFSYKLWGGGQRRGALVFLKTKIKEDVVFNRFEKRNFLERKKNV
jgi:hypothetical protein